MSGTIRALLVDDEPLVRRGLRQALAEVAPDVEVVGEARHGAEALEQVAALGPALVFLDVQMPGMDGLAVARALAAGDGPLVVFVTAYDQYALEAFEVHAVDYLLKPFDAGRLRTALERVRRRLGEERGGEGAARLAALLERLAPRAEAPVQFLARVGTRAVVVPAESVEWFEAADNYVRLHTADGVHVVRETLRGLEERLDARQFARIHRSTIVNLRRVRELRALPSGDCTVRLASGAEVALSRRFRAAVEARLEGRQEG